MFGRRVEPRSRRRFTGSFDRRVAGAAVGTAVVVFVPLLAFTRAPEPPLVRTDKRAALAFVGLLARGEHRDFIIDSTFTRSRINGPTLRAQQIEARWGRVHVLSGGGTAEIDLPTKTYVCAALKQQTSCDVRPASAPSSTARAMAIAIGSGTYDVVRTASESLASERAACFDVKLRHGAVADPGLGDDTLVCLARDGLVLRARVRTAVGVDDLQATRLQRHVDDAAIQSLLKGFEPAPERVRG